MSIPQGDQIRPAVLGGDASFQIGRYEIRGEIGRGTMGVVYEAYDPSLGRTIALKTFHLSFAVSPRQFKSFEERFIGEARIAARLSHPGIVAVHDVGCDSDLGTLYIALEYLHGRTLHEVIQAGAPLAWREALRITCRVAEALHYAHAQQVVHRDIKPANIMQLPSGDPKILDFGIARVETSLGATTGQVLGTPLFMAPEQALGLKSDGRADLFSLGSIAYTLLTGRFAFEGRSIPATVRRLLEDDPEPPSRVVPDLPRGVDELIVRALAKSPERRYSCGQALADDIQDLLDGPRVFRETLTSAEIDLATAPSAPPPLDLDAEFAALVSSPAAPPDPDPDPAPARHLRRPDHRIVHAAVAVSLLCVGYMALLRPSPGPERPVWSLPDSPSPPPTREGPTVGVRAEGGSTASNRPSPKPVAETARLKIRLEHPLGNGRLRIWVDDRMVLQQRMPKGPLDRLLAVEPGTRTVRVQVRWDDKDRDATLSGRFAPGAVRQLDVNLGRIRKNLSMKWKGSSPS